MTSQEILDKVLAGGELSAAEIDEIVKTRLRERLTLEYKHGDLLKQKDAAAALREQVSAFANGAGGILLVGIDAPEDNAKAWSVAGGIAPTKKKDHGLARWAGDALSPLSPPLVPFPRITVTRHGEHEILVVGVYRSQSIVACIEAGRPVYYLRFHDGTHEVPDYRIADLLLGRRQVPQLDLEIVEMRTTRHLTGPEGPADVSFDLTIRVSNVGLVWADELRALIGSHCAINHPKSHVEEGSRLAAFVEAGQAPPGHGVCFVFRVDSGQPTLRPFESVNMRFQGSPVLRLPKPTNNWHWRFGIGLLCRGTAPIWFDVALEGKGDSQATVTPSNGRARLAVGL